MMILRSHVRLVKEIAKVVDTMDLSTQVAKVQTEVAKVVKNDRRYERPGAQALFASSIFRSLTLSFPQWLNMESGNLRKCESQLINC